MRRIIPLGDRVLVKPYELSKSGNILIADLGQERPEMGKVIAIGEEYNTRFQVGDILLLPKIGTLRIEIDGEEFYIAQIKEVLAKIEDE